jgi:hypothetical protein
MFQITGDFRSRILQPDINQQLLCKRNLPKWHKYICAAKALFSCPAIISQRLESRILSNEPLENTEEESKII